MSRQSFLLSDELHAYVVAHTTSPDAVQQALIDETAAHPAAQMQVSPDIGALLTLLTRLVDARRAVEVGTFTGYSSIAIARGLAPGGSLQCFDISEEYTAVARRYWEAAGVADRISLQIGPALDGLRALPADADLDLAFVDADKTGYLDYYEELVPRLRPGGLVVADNTLQEGRVVDPADTSASVEAIRAYNDRVAGDDRVDVVLLALGDGLSVARRR
jgi:caffeoyl-CoA O-methyltransferase